MAGEDVVLLLLAVVFLATLIRSAFGFGEALVSVPLLARFIPVKVAAPLAVLLSIVVAAVILVQDRRKVHVGSAWRLVLPTLFGIPLGLLLLRNASEPVVKGILAVVILGFSLYSLMGQTHFELKSDRSAWAFGFLAGILGGAYGMNGPPLVIFGSLRRWTPEHFRATLQGYFLPASAIIMAGYWLDGLWVPAVTRYFLLSLPVALAAIFLGRWINRRIQAQAFIRYIHIGLLGVGTMLLFQALGQ